MLQNEFIVDAQKMLLHVSGEERFEIAIPPERLMKEAHKNGFGAIKSKRFQFAIARVNWDTESEPRHTINADIYGGLVKLSFWNFYHFWGNPSPLKVIKN